MTITLDRPATPSPAAAQPADAGTFDRTPPHDDLAEQCVLGAMMLSADAIADIVETVTAADFYQPKHAVIYTTIVDLYGRSEPADAVTVAAALLDAGTLTRVGGDYPHTLVSVVPTAANGAYYAGIVADRAKLRRLIEAGTRVTQLGYGAAGGGDADSLIDQAQQTLYGLDGQRRNGDAPVLAELMQPAMDELESIGQRSGAMLGVPTGFVDLDRLLNGLQAGQLVVMAGRPGTGKSTLALDVLRACTIRQNLPAMIASLEMSQNEIVMRLLSAEARVPLQAMRSGNLSDEQWTMLARRMGEISEAPLYVDDAPNMSLMEIRARARRMRQRHDIRLLVVDYLQLMTMTTSGRQESREQEIAALSRGLKLLAKELEIPVVAVAQLNRGPEQRTDKTPTLADLRGSGAIEQDADVVLFVHRDDYYDKESARAGEADLVVAKHRNGPTDTVTVAAQLHLSRFKDLAA